MTSVSAVSSLRRSRSVVVPSRVTPGWAKTTTGKWRSTIASGPWKKSADEKRSATT
jgi:hypothetical protein